MRVFNTHRQFACSIGVTQSLRIPITAAEKEFFMGWMDGPHTLNHEHESSDIISFWLQVE